MYTLEPALRKEAGICMEIIREGRDFQNEQGFTQWTEDYPSIDTIRDDIEHAKGYVLKADGRIAGYLCVDFGGEPAYVRIQGAWRAEKPYAVIHRLAFRKEFRGMGLSAVAFQLTEKLCVQNGVSCIRVDTDLSNARMQHILEKNGFVYCGKIFFQGCDRAAYDRLL